MVQAIEEFIKDSSTDNNGSGSNIERWYSGEAQQAKLNLSVKSGVEQSPDQSARIIKAQVATGLAPDLVERNIDEIDSNIKKSSIDTDSLNKYNPVVSKWVSENPHHASAAQDDIENLKNIENSVQDYSMLRSMYLALGKGSASAMSSVSRIPATIYDVAAIPQNLAAKFADRPDLMVKSPDWLLNNPVAKYFDRESNSYQIPDLERSIVSEIKNGNYARAGRTLAAQFVANAPQQAAIIAGALSGQSVAALIGAGATQAAGVNKESRDAGADPLQSASNALLQGTIESAFESLGTLGVLKHWENKIAESYGKQVARQVYVDFAKTIGYSFAAEGNEEFLTQMAQDFSDFITGVNPNAMQGTVERSLNAGIIGGVSGSLMTSPAALVSGVQRGQDIRQSTLTRDFYLSLGSSVEASKLRERLPEATKTLVERMTKDSSVENVYIPVDKFDKYFQDANIDPVSEMQKLGATNAYDEAKQTGADVKIPLSTWVDNFVGTDHYKALANDVKFSPEDLSVNQHAELKKQVQEMDSKQQTESQPQQVDRSSEIGANVKEQLKSAGFDESTSDSYSKLVQSTFKNLGNRAGVDPVELFDRYGLKIQRQDNSIGGVQALNQPFQNDARGQLRFGENRQFNIDLLKNADLSTFLHETGHFNLEVFADLAISENTPQQIKDDFSTLLKWFNVDSRDKIGKDQHEQFARGFESYLMEGKAPSAELQSVFSRFRAWLISIYRDIRNLNVQLTPGVRSVMDRLLASDEEIKATEFQQNIQPLFSDPASFGMSESEAANYSKALSDAKLFAEQELAAKLIGDVTRERTKWWNDEREKIRADVELEIGQLPEYRALDVLQGKKVGDIEPFKLSKKYIVEDYSEFALSNFPKPYIYSKEGGLHPDVAAEILGFNSGHELLFKVETAEPRKSIVNRITEERMRERHGDFLTDGRLPEEALRAVHNEKRAELLRKELEYLASEKIAVLKGLVRRISSPIPTIEAVRTQAERLIASKKIRDISPSLYMRAEAKASKSAVESLLKGDVELAFAEKQKELFNHELYRSAVAAKEEVDSVVAYLSKFNKETTREKLAKAGADYLEQIDSILERFDFRKSISLAAIDRKKSLLTWVQEQNKQGLTVDIPQNILDDAFAQHYKDTTFETLQGIRDSVKTIEHLARVKNQLLASARAKELEVARDEITSEISAYFNTEKEPVEIAPGLKDRIIDGLKKNIADHTRMEFLFEHLGGNNPHGVVWEYFFKPVAEAEDVENEMRRKDADALSNIFGAYSRKERAEWFTKRFFIPEMSTNSTTGNFTKASMLAVALNWGNQYNREALMESYGWSEAQVNSILTRLDQKDWETVQAVWDHIESYWPAIAEQEKQLNGIAPQKVEAADVVTRHGTFRGGYYPIVFDSKQSWRQSVIEEKNTVQEMFGGNWAKAMTRHGHTKERVGTGGKPLLLELSGLSNHLSAVIHDLAFRPTIVDLNRLANDPIIRSSIASAAGRHMAKQLNPWLHAIAGDRPVEPMNAMEGLLGKARNGATVVALGLKLTSAMAQTLGYTIATKELGVRYAAQGMKDAYLNPTRISKKWEFITERSKMMRDRISNYDRDIRDFSRAPGLTPDASAWFVFVGYMDLAMSIPAWLGAYSKAMDGRLANVQKGDENSAVDYADSVVRMTQAAGAAKDLASVQRGGQAWKLFTMFYSSMSVQFNQFQKAAQEYSLNKDIPRLLGSLSLLWFIPAVLEEIIRGRGPDDEDKAGWFLRKTLLYPLQTVVLIRDLANALDRYIETGKKDFDGSPVFSIGESALGTAGLVGSALSSRDVTRPEVRDAIMMTGYVAQLPARQVWQTGEFLYDWMTGRKTPNNLQGVLSGLISGNPK